MRLHSFIQNNKSPLIFAIVSHLFENEKKSKNPFGGK
jgi:hypothetical protein